jgi:hypothetical protein
VVYLNRGQLLIINVFIKNMKYKIIGIFVLLSVLFVSAPKAAKANVWDDFIASLQPQQVAELQSAIALKAVTVNPIPVSACLPTTAPSITVTSPSIGETYTVGKSVTITWTSCNVSGNIYLGLVNGGHDSGLLSESPVPVTQGSYQWTVPMPEVLGNNYQIVAYTNPTDEIQGRSGTFTISAVTPLPAPAPVVSSTDLPKPPVSPTPVVGVTRGVKVVLVENPGGACKTSSTGQTPSTTPLTGQCASNTPSRWGNLVFHTKSDAVRTFQIILQNGGYLPASAKADGNLGPVTQAAINALQKAIGITQTGIIDSATANALGTLAIQQSSVKPVNIQPANIPVGSIIVSGGSSCTVWSVNSSNVATLLGSGSGAYDQSGVWMGCLMNGIVYHSSF